jgi:hypothetical protein
VILVKKFPGADFCHPCKLWVERDVLNTHNCTSQEDMLIRFFMSPYLLLSRQKFNGEMLVIPASRIHVMY